jgi:hypothetical protein
MTTLHKIRILWQDWREDKNCCHFAIEVNNLLAKKSGEHKYADTKVKKSVKPQKIEKIKFYGYDDDGYASQKNLITIVDLVKIYTEYLEYLKKWNIKEMNENKRPIPSSGKCYEPSFVGFMNFVENNL